MILKNSITCQLIKISVKFLISERRQPWIKEKSFWPRDTRHTIWYLFLLVFRLIFCIHLFLFALLKFALGAVDKLMIIHQDKCHCDIVSQWFDNVNGVVCCQNLLETQKEIDRKRVREIKAINTHYISRLRNQPK